MESTYGDRDHRSWDATRAEVEEVAGITRNAKGNILIPAFGVGRTQLLLYWMAHNREQAALSDWQIFLDSPLAIRATQVYSNFIKLLDKEARDLWQYTEIKHSLPNLSSRGPPTSHVKSMRFVQARLSSPAAACAQAGGFVIIFGTTLRAVNAM